MSNTTQQRISKTWGAASAALTLVVVLGLGQLPPSRRKRRLSLIFTTSPARRTGHTRTGDRSGRGHPLWHHPLRWR